MLPEAQIRGIALPKYSPFSHVASEIILAIAEFLEPAGLNALIQTSPSFATLLDSMLYDQALTFELDDPTWGLIKVLEWASLNGQSTVVEKLLKRNADISTKGQSDWTLLHYAVGHGQGATAQLLLDAGADVFAVDAEGHTPLHFAFGCGFKDIGEMLLNAGADLTAKTRRGDSVLCSACSNGQKAAVEQLLELYKIQGISIQEKNEEGLAPFAYRSMGRIQCMIYMEINHCTLR